MNIKADVVLLLLQVIHIFKGMIARKAFTIYAIFVMVVSKVPNPYICLATHAFFIPDGWLQLSDVQYKNYDVQLQALKTKKFTLDFPSPQICR